MEASQSPTPIPAVWANAATGSFINAIPTPSQQSVKAGAASFTDGFPPLCFVPFASGGAGPFGADFNGIFAQLSAGLQWGQAGGFLPYSGSFSTTIGGYANGAIIQSAARAGLFWRSLVDNNTSDPDTGGANWVIWPGTVTLAADQTYFVNASTGNDSNNGLTSGTAWLTLQHAWNFVQSTINFNGFTVTVDCTGAFAAGVNATGSLTGAASGALIFSFASGSTIGATNSTGFIVNDFANIAIVGSGSGVTITASGTGANEGFGILVLGGGICTLQGGVTFGSCATSQIEAAEAGSNIILQNTITFSGSAFAAINAENLGFISVQGSAPGATLVFSSAVYSGATVVASALALVALSETVTTFSGSATGVRFSATLNACILTNGGGATFIPGSTAGGTSTGGQYD